MKGTKYIEIDVHSTRDKVFEGLLTLSYVPTHAQFANVFTNILPYAQMKQLLSKLDMFSPMPNLTDEISVDV